MKYLRLIPVAFLCIFAVNTLAASNIVWPPPPEKARISYEKSVMKAEDLGISKGFFTKIWEFFAGAEENSLVKPFGIHIDADKIYVTDMAQKSVIVFDTKRENFESIDGYKGQRFSSPIDVTTDEKGNIYITDSVLQSLFIYNSDLDPIKKIHHPSSLLRPTGVAVDHVRDRIYVSDTLSSHIKVYKKDGTYIDNISRMGEGEGELNKPTYITLDSRGNLYVADSMNRRVLMFNPDGEYIRRYGQSGDSIGSFSSPRGIAVDKFDNLYVTDTLFDAVQIFNSDGELLLVFGKRGVGDGEFVAPQDISISKDGTIYVTDSYNMRIELFNMLEYQK